jgi:hypothetical protein
MSGLFCHPERSEGYALSRKALLAAFALMPMPAHHDPAPDYVTAAIRVAARQIAADSRTP